MRRRAGRRTRSTDHFGGWVEGIVESIRRTRKLEKPFSPFHKGDGHVTDDTLMTRVLVHAYDVKRDHLDAYDVELLMLPEIVDTKTWVPELGREDLLYHRLFLAEKWLVLKLRYGHADPRDAGVGQHRQLRRGDVHRPGRDRERGRPGRRLRRGARPDRGPPVELRARGRRGDRRRASPRRCGRSASVDSVVETALRLAKDGDTARRSRRSWRRPRTLDGWRSGGLEQLRARVRAVRLRRRGLRGARR